MRRMRLVLAAAAYVSRCFGDVCYIAAVWSGVPGLHPDVVCGGETADMLCEVMLLTHVVVHAWLATLVARVLGWGLFTYRLAYAPGYGLRSY